MSPFQYDSDTLLDPHKFITNILTSQDIYLENGQIVYTVTYLWIILTFIICGRRRFLKIFVELDKDSDTKRVVFFIISQTHFWAISPTQIPNCGKPVGLGKQEDEMGEGKSSSRQNQPPQIYTLDPAAKYIQT